MNDIEELLRTTLDDPARRIPAEAGHLDSYRRRARALHRRRTVASSVAVAAVLAVAGVAIAAQASRSPGARQPTAAIPPTPSATPKAPDAVAAGTLPVVGTRAFGGVPDAVDAVLSDGSLWVLTGKGVVHRVDPASGHDVMADKPIPLAAGATARGIAAGQGRVWAWSVGGTPQKSVGALTEYDAAPFRLRRSVALSVDVSAADLLDGELWLATDTGLYRLPADAQQPQRVTDKSTFTVLADRARHRVLFDDGTSLDLVSYDPVKRRETARVALDLGKISIALSKNGQLWVAGYGSAGARKALHLDADNLHNVGGTPLNEHMGAGATVWPGDAVVWVENNGNNVSCVDALTGKILTAGLLGNYRIGSTTGFGFRVGDSGLERLDLPAGCPG